MLHRVTVWDCHSSKFGPDLARHCLKSSILPEKVHTLQQQYLISHEIRSASMVASDVVRVYVCSVSMLFDCDRVIGNGSTLVGASDNSSLYFVLIICKYQQPERFPFENTNIHQTTMKFIAATTLALATSAVNAFAPSSSTSTRTSTGLHAFTVSWL